MSKIMLGKLVIGGWGARVKAAKVAAEAEQKAKAKKGVVTASLHLMTDVPSFKRTRDTATMLRTAWTQVSLPWFDGKGNYRAVALDGVWLAKEKMGEWARTYDAVVDEFIRDYSNGYDTMLAKQQFDMGEFFDRSLFPTPREVKRKFYLITDWMALPNPDDIRLGDRMTPEEVAQMQQEAAERTEERFAKAMNTAATRLYKVVEAMHQTMATPIGAPGAKFNDTKLENIIDLVEIMPMLNIGGDPKLAELAKQAKKLATKSPDELREDAVKRASAADEAKKLASRLANAFDVTGNESDDEEE
jgi:Asp-tRNA(Asn)/Glu-tRNA(Gln) amidotransferase C subunit